MCVEVTWKHRHHWLCLTNQTRDTRGVKAGTGETRESLVLDLHRLLHKKQHRVLSKPSNLIALIDLPSLAVPQKPRAHGRTVAKIVVVEGKQTTRVPVIVLLEAQQVGRLVACHFAVISAIRRVIIEMISQEFMSGVSHCSLSLSPKSASCRRRHNSHKRARRVAMGISRTIPSSR